MLTSTMTPAVPLTPATHVAGRALLDTGLEVVIWVLHLSQGLVVVEV